jgi:hypothetical protein
MLGKLIPVLLAVMGLGAGVGAGVALRPAPEPVAMVSPCGDIQDETKVAKAVPEDPAKSTDHDYVKMNNQFVVPVVDKGRVSALVVMALSLEVEVGQSETIYKREPKLRDAFLSVMFDHANAGGFDGAFTNSNNMDILRNALREVAKKILGPIISDVLIIDVVRQDA